VESGIPSTALLLAGGFGTRLRPLTATVPKCLVPIGGRPLLDHWFSILFGAGIKCVLVNTHYRASQVADFCHESIWCRQIKLVHEETLLGTCGTLRENRAFFEGQPFWFIHADNLSRFDPILMWRRHMESPAGCIGTMMTFYTEYPSECGIVTLRDDGVIDRYFEKVANPPGALANGAVFILNPEIFLEIEKRRDRVDFCADIVPHLVGRLYTFHNEIYHRDIGSPESYRIACKDFEQWTQNASL